MVIGRSVFTELAVFHGIVHLEMGPRVGSHLLDGIVDMAAGQNSCSFHQLCAGLWCQAPGSGLIYGVNPE